EAESHGDEHASAGQEQRGGEARTNFPHDGLLRADGFAEVALHHAAEEREVLPDRVGIEVVLFAELFKRFTADAPRIFPEPGAERIAGGDPQHQEDEYGDSEQNRQQAEQASGYVPEHQPPDPRVSVPGW